MIQQKREDEVQRMMKKKGPEREKKVENVGETKTMTSTRILKGAERRLPKKVIVREGTETSENQSAGEKKIRKKTSIEKRKKTRIVKVVTAAGAGAGQGTRKRSPRVAGIGTKKIKGREVIVTKIEGTGIVTEIEIQRNERTEVEVAAR